MWSQGGVSQPSFLPPVLSGHRFTIRLRLGLLLKVLLLIVVFCSPEKKDMRFRRMDLVMDPAQALLDADSPPFVIREEAKGTRVIITEVALGDELEERLRKDHMSIFVLFVRVSI